MLSVQKGLVVNHARSVREEGTAPCSASSGNALHLLPCTSPSGGILAEDPTTTPLQVFLRKTGNAALLSNA